VEQFGGPEMLMVRDVALTEPGPGQVVVRLTSIGMNHADLLARQGLYKIASGEPPFTPGLEGGGVIDAVGAGVDSARLGHRVILSPAATRRAADGFGGTYRSHYLANADMAMPAPDAISDEQLGALWLSYLTAWGCLVLRQNIEPGQIVALPAASSCVALAAAQIVKQHGAMAIGLTSREQKVQTLRELDACAFDHIVVTHEESDGQRGEMTKWHRQIKEITEGRGVDVFLDPVAAGAYLNTEILCLAPGGTIWVYGLLGKADVVDVVPLIRKSGAIRGWMVAELVAEGPQAWEPGCRHILDGFTAGHYRQHIDTVFNLSDARQAHVTMEKGQHVGKLVIVP